MNMMKIFVLLFCISIQILSISPKILPKNFPEFCSISEQNYNKCMEKELKKMGPFLLKGIKSIGFPSLHPLLISSVSVNGPISKYITFQSELKNMQFYGYNKMELKKFEFDPTSLTGRVFLYMPHYNFKFEYNASGVFRNFRLRNVGYLTGNASEIDLKFYFKLKKINKIGIDYLTFDKFEAKGNIQNVYVKPISRDPEKQLICDLAASVINEHSKEIMQLGSALHDEVLTRSYKKLIGQFLSAVPKNEILPK